jgi:hypothetical protein
MGREEAHKRYLHVASHSYISGMRPSVHIFVSVIKQTRFAQGFGPWGARERYKSHFPLGLSLVYHI